MRNSSTDDTPQAGVLEGANIIAAKEIANERESGVQLSEHAEKSNRDVSNLLNDCDDPVNWKPAYKWTLMILVSLMSTFGSLATITIVPAVPLVLQQYPPPASYYSTLIVSIWEIGEGLGPFAIGPLAEIYGRLPVLHVGNVLFVAFLIGSALSTSASMLIAMRFLSALFITPLTLSPTIASDLFPPEQRGAAMSLAMVLPLAVPPAAPIVGSYISDSLGWRWTAWIVAIPSGAVTLLLIIMFRETYLPVIARKKHKLATPLASEHEGEKERRFTAKAVFRPLYLLAFAPPVSTMSLYMALVYGVNYLVFTTLTEMLESVYAFRQASVGLGFLGIGVGMIIGIIVYGMTSDRYLKYRSKSKGKFQPEDRLPFVLCGGLLAPAGIILYGWSAEYHLHWIVPIIGTGILGAGIILVQTPVENYLVDGYEAWSASAVSIAIIVRALTGAILPLAGPELYVKLGYGWGNTLLALLLLLFAPIVVLLMFKGPQLRQSSRLNAAMGVQTHPPQRDV